MTQPLIDPRTVTLEREDAGGGDFIWFTPEQDFMVQKSTSDKHFFLYRVVNGESVEPKWGPDGFDSLVDARHDIALQRFHRDGNKVPNGTEGPDMLKAMFSIGGSK